MFSLLQGEPGVPGQSGAPGKEGLIGPKVWGLSTVDRRGSEWGRDNHSRIMRVSCQKGCGRLGHWGSRVRLVLRFQGGLGSQWGFW